MKALKRYSLLLVGLVIFLALRRVYIQHGANLFCWPSHHPGSEFEFSQYFTERKAYYTIETFRKHSIASTSDNLTKRWCHMDTCFDFARCKQLGQNVKIYIYPNDGQHASPTFLKIIKYIKESKYYEPDPNKGNLEFMIIFYFIYVFLFL